MSFLRINAQEPTHKMILHITLINKSDPLLIIFRDVVSKTLDELESHKWFDLQTRAAFIEMHFFNHATNLLSFVRLAAEFPPQGEVFLFVNPFTL